ncbi:MAG: LamG domain-containing protein, partial [Planctomycetota bacterium]|nr:LamG domain-containing protein [Planctomycetota bacterium]
MCRRLICLVSLVLVLIAAGSAWADLVGHWTLDDGSGATVSDSSGNGNDGTIVGDPTWIPGMAGMALEFHGLGGAVGGADHINCGNDASLDITGPTSIALWIRPDADDPEGQGTATAPMCKAQSGMSPSWSYQVRYGWNSPQPYMAFTFNTSPRAWAYVGKNLERFEWVHIACSYDGTTLTTYLNGEATESTPMGPITSSETPVLIGSDGWGSDWIGAIDDVRIYDHALSEPEILGTMEGEMSPQAWGPTPKNGELYLQTWASLSWKPGPFAVSHDVYIGDNFDDVDSGAADTFIGNQGAPSLVVGFPGFPVPDGLVPGTTYYWRIDEVNDADPNSPWKGDIWSFSIPPKTAYFPDPRDGAEFVEPDTTFSWTGGYGAKLHTVYIGNNFEDVSNAAGGAPQGTTTYTPTLELEKVYYWRVDEFDSVATYKGDIWSFTTPGSVGNPQPANGAVDVSMTSALGWTAADNAASHEVYFGIDGDAVNNATTASPEYVGARALGSESYDPGKLAWHSSYHWRVDEVYPAETVKGLVWSFTTADYILVEDFESYNDIDPPDAESNRIFDKWIDGFGTTTNGALVGNDLPPYAEQTIVRSGAQSMIYRYDNNLKTSEATLTLVSPRDWTEEGVTKLSLWFRGGSANAAERMFVALNGNAVVYHDDPAATQMAGWRKWVIELQAFADQGVNLANVNTIGIGFGTKNAPGAGGPGTMYFDDIQLTKPAAAPVDPNPIGMWNLDEGAGDTAADGSGNGLDGAIVGALWLSPGSNGAGFCLDFDGLGDNLVDLGNFDVTTGDGLTIALWYKADNLDTPGNDPRMFSKAIGGSSQDHWFMVSSSRVGTDKVLRFRLKTDEDTGEIKADTTTGLIDLDVWTHVAAVWDGAAMK